VLIFRCRLVIYGHLTRPLEPFFWINSFRDHPKDLYDILEPFPHLAHDTVKNMFVPYSEFLGHLVADTVHDQTHAGGIHGIIDHVHEPADAAGFSNSDGQVEYGFGNIADPFQKSGTTGHDHA